MTTKHLTAKMLEEVLEELAYPQMKVSLYSQDNPPPAEDIGSSYEIVTLLEGPRDRVTTTVQRGVTTLKVLGNPPMAKVTDQDPSFSATVPVGTYVREAVNSPYFMWAGWE